ncbi:hypothetical protein CHUAL_005326 [Chamberlinius hualienensis]
MTSAKKFVVIAMLVFIFFASLSSQSVLNNDPSQTNLIREKRQITCGLFGSNSLCSAHCRLDGKRRGGFCKGNTCVCRKN